MYDYLAKIILLGPSGAGKSCLLHRFVKNEWRVLSSQTIGVEFSSKIVKIGGNSSARGGSITTSSKRRIKLQLWDTAGTERFRSVSRSYYRGAAGAILIYDVASLSSFNALPTFLMDARSLASPNLTVILAGNKADLVNPTPPNLRPESTSSQNSSWKESPHTPNSISSKSSATFGFADSGTNTTRSRGDSINLTSTKWTATQTSEGRAVSADTAARWASKANVPAVMEVSAYSGMNVEELFNRLARMILTKIELGEIDPDDPNSGIQYGDLGSAGWDAGSVADESVMGDGSTLRRRRKKRSNVLLGGNVGEWRDVFRKPGGAGGCC